MKYAVHRHAYNPINLKLERDARQLIHGLLEPKGGVHTWVVEWLPHTATRSTDVKKTPALLASWNLARFSSRRVRAWKFSLGMEGALAAAMSALVLQGLPTTMTFTDFLATCKQLPFNSYSHGRMLA